MEAGGRDEATGMVIGHGALLVASMILERVWAPVVGDLQYHETNPYSMTERTSVIHDYENPVVCIF